MKLRMDRVRRVVGSLSLSAAVLAIANIEVIWQGYHPEDVQETHLHRVLPQHKLASRPVISSSTSTVKPLQSELSQALEQDELKDQNPYTELSTMDPLQQIMRRGVSKFHRETYRSPQFRDESGYDLVSYSIEHEDGSMSSILAYLEHTEPTKEEQEVGHGDARVPFVIFLVSNGEGSRSYFFRSGQLVEQSDLSGEEAKTLVSHRLSQGVPFFSVSR